MATSGLGHATSTKPRRTCERQVQDSRPTTRTHSSSAQACAEKGLTLHLLDVVPATSRCEAHGLQDLNATQCVRAGWRAGESVVGRLGAGACARWGGQTTFPLQAMLPAEPQRATRGDAGDFEKEAVFGFR